MRMKSEEGGKIVLKDKFNMTRKQSISLAKRNVIDYIWKSANLEGIMITYPDTEALYKGVNVQSVSVDDIVLINNLKHAWVFVMDTIDYPVDFGYICKVNQIVGANLYYSAGYIRNIPVTIGGTDWIPDLPDEATIKREIGELLQIESATDRALSLMAYIMRKQIFLDGNKRTANLIANQVLIGKGCGVVSVPQSKMVAFLEEVKHYYETNELERFKRYVYDECIEGGEFAEREASDVEKQDELLLRYDKIQSEHRIRTLKENRALYFGGEE